RDAPRESRSCRALPVRFREPTGGEEPLQAEHRGVGGEDDELAAVGRQLEPAVEGVSEVGLELDRVFGEPAVAEAECKLGGPAAARDEGLLVRQKWLEVDVPDP